MKGKRQPAAVVLVNLGTPAQPTPGAVRKFLLEFLSDPRVVEIPRIIWLFILRALVLPLRSKRVANAYKIIWTERGSPLRWITEDQAKFLQAALAEQYPDRVPTVTHAMTYGEPAIDATLTQLYESGHRRILVLPMYPQYSGSTTGAVYDQIASYLKKNRALPGLSIINAYFYKPAYIKALSDSIREYWDENGRGDHLLFSYHGIPVSYVKAGDPYTGHCECTTSAVAEELGLAESEFSMSYQSRFGKAEWVQPYTDGEIESLAKSGLKTLDVICPAFSADCLETIEEIAVQNAELFQQAGGQSLRLIPCLSASAGHIEALQKIVSPYLDAMD